MFRSSIHIFQVKKSFGLSASFFFVFGMLFNPSSGFSQTRYPANQNFLVNESTFPRLILTSGKELSPYCVFTILSNIGYSGLFIFAPNGEPLFYKRIEAQAYDFKLLPNGYMSYFDKSRGGFILLDSMLKEVDVIRAKNGYVTDLHEIIVAPDGDYLLFGLDIHEVDMSTIVSGGYAKAQVKDMVIQKIDSEENVVFEWNSRDHFNILDTYANVLSHVIDYVHFNSIEFDSDSTIIVSSRNMSELTRIDLNTGDIIWRMGGKNNQFTLKNFERPPSGQHTIRKKNDSIFTIFDNGSYSDDKYSMGVEFSIDEDSMVAEKITGYRREPDVFSSILGNLQNLGNGNSVVFWGINQEDEIGGLFTEYNTEQEIVQEGKFINCESPTYRVQKFNWENKAFSSNEKNLSFPDTEYGDSVIRAIILSNHLNENLVLNEFVSSSGDFRINEDSIMIAPKSQALADVVFRPSSNADYSDTLTLRSNMNKQSIAMQIAVSGTGYGYTSNIGAVINREFHVFPNPFSKEIHYSSYAEPERLEITNLSGRRVWYDDDIHKQGNIETSEIGQGVYIISSYQQDGSVSHKKIIKTVR